jgi:phenylpyruvate tautomerase PptA (4-oxalocrotonate tautomerase family)
MPCLSLETNQSIENKEEVMKKLSELLARETGKPEAYIMITITDKSDLYFAGSDAPAAFVEVKSIGFPENGPASLSSAVCSFLSEETGIPTDRIYIVFRDVPRSMWGWNGTTF